jgi:hypothetical protein
MFTAKGFDGFTHTIGLSYLKVFLQHIYKRAIQELYDLLTIQAQWAASFMFRSFSQEGHTIQSLTRELDEFDNSLGNDGTRGAALIAMLARYDRDQSRDKVIRELLSEINKEALDILMRTADSLDNIAKNVETAKNDYYQNIPTLIVNWRELEVTSRRNISVWLKTCSDTLSKFLELCRLFIEH